MSRHVNIPPASSGSSTPEDVALTRARSLLGTTIDFIGGSSFDNDQWYRAVLTSGTVTYSVTDRGGVLQMATTATNSRNAQVFPHGSTTISIDNPSTTKWYFRARQKFTSAIDANAILIVGLGTAALGAPFLRMGARGSQSTGFFSLSTTNNAGADQYTATTTVAYQTTAYTLFEAWNDATNITFAIDGTTVGSTASTNMGSSPVTPFALVLNGATNADRTMSLDEMYVCCPKQT